MNFLEANRILSEFSGGESLPFLLAMSGTADQFDVHLRAAAAKLGRAAIPRTLLFNTLSQALLQPPHTGEREVFLLLPWDLAPETDWRSGFPLASVGSEEIRERAQAVARRLAERPTARFLYLPAPLLPLFPNFSDNVALANWLSGLSASIGAYVLPAESFSLGGYLASGCPIGGAWLGKVAETIIERVIATPAESCKVLVTDLDQTLWSGVVSEDGLDGIFFTAEGLGYRHFLYQSLLAKLKQEGVLLAAVSRNDSKVALEPLRSGRMLLKEDDFICVLCSYSAKSAQIRELARRLNLGVESLVFVDDNPVELVEVSTQLPDVHCLSFPTREDQLPDLFMSLNRAFAKSLVSAEDRERTEMYRRRLLDIVVPGNGQGGDITAFLRDLQMTLTLHDRAHGARERIIQLLNKTNQFNLNGRRVSDEEVAGALRAGARLYSATLSDRSGIHGEILACLVSPERVITSLAMSCRVFQRRLEYAFFAWLSGQKEPPAGLAFASTPRNRPVQDFLQDPAFIWGGDSVVKFDAVRFAESHADDLRLFTVVEPANE